jgi:radical SAM enzyme (TIGR01210 family)
MVRPIGLPSSNFSPLAKRNIGVPSMRSTNDPPETWHDARILALRPSKNAVDPWQPYAYLVEAERTRAGIVADTGVVFLTNRECPFRCLMCDLWKNTTDSRVPLGAIPAQIQFALNRLPPIRHVKLYNAGNFFDAQAIPPADWTRIAELLDSFETIIVENHPRLVSRRCLEFRDLLHGEFQVAMGLETVHPQVLPRLNKQMTLDDFARATEFLASHEIPVRAFILLRSPFLSEEEGVRWAKESIRFAFDAGVECCVIIPTRSGNGAMEVLERQGQFAPPCLRSLEEVLAFGICQERGRVFADLWDVEKLHPCEDCRAKRILRLREMNLTQSMLPPVSCACEGSG